MNQHSQQSTDEVPDIELMEQVAIWLLKLESEDCTEQDRIDFIHWQQQNPKNVEILKQMQNTFEQFSGLKKQSKSIPYKVIEQTIQQSKTRSIFKSNPIFIVILTTLLTSTFLWQILPTSYWLADTRNNYNQWSEHTLTDHSDIKISGNSAYNILFDKENRIIELLTGNILIDVAKDTNRPFIIKTESAQIRALGTRFIVQHNKQTTVLTMLHSTTEVTVKLANGQSQVQQIHAGEQIIIDEDGLHPKQNISVELTEKAWNEQMLMINLMPLDQLLNILQTYEKQKLKYDAATLHPIEVTATLPLDGTGLKLLQRSLPITVQTDMFGRKVIQKK